MIDIDNNEYFTVFTMPGGEPHLKWKQEVKCNLFTHLLARINSGNDLIKLLVTTDALIRTNKTILNVTIPYFPGARQDRVPTIGEPLTVKVYADIINSQKYIHLDIIDPHSDVTAALLNNVRILPVQDYLKDIVTKYKYDTIIIPDAGAAKKTYNYYFPDQEFNFANGLNFVQCLKNRDTLTGKLSGFKCGFLPSECNCLIVDDICDGGGTFKGLLEAINSEGKSRSNYIQKVGLYTTHGIYSKGVEVLNGFNEIFTTNSIREEQLEGVIVYKI